MRRLLFLALVLAGCSRGKPEPNLQVLDPAFDLGSIHTEDLQQKIVRLKNTGAAPLEIRDVQVSCGCTRPDFPKVIQPGQTGEMKIDYQPDLLAQGKHTESLNIVTNDPDAPAAEVLIHADLQPPIIVDQKKPLGITFTPGKQKSVAIRFSRREEGPPPITAVECKDPRVVVGLRSERDVSEVVVIVGTSPSAGDYNPTLLLQTSIESLPIIEFPIVAKADSGPYANPAVIYLDKLPEPGTRLAVLSIMCRGGKVKVNGVTPQIPELEAKVDRSTEDRTWIPVVYKGGLEAGSLVTAIQINTDHPTWPIMNVPVVIKSAG